MVASWNTSKLYKVLPYMLFFNGHEPAWETSSVQLHKDCLENVPNFLSKHHLKVLDHSLFTLEYQAMSG